MSLSFTQLQQMLSTNLKLVGRDIDSQQKELNQLKKELSLLKIVNLQVLQNQSSIMEAMNSNGITVKLTPITEVTTADPGTGTASEEDGTTPNGAA